MDLTSYLEYLLQQVKGINFEIISPNNCRERGAQLSLLFQERGKEIHQQITNAGIIVDWREPGGYHRLPYITHIEMFFIFMKSLLVLLQTLN
jgi:kynureninase